MSGKYATIPHRVKYPWYKKPLSNRRYQCGVLDALDTSGWISVVPGLDDFRSGPPTSDKGSIQPARKLGQGVRLVDVERFAYDVGVKSTSSRSSDFEKLSSLSIPRRKDRASDFDQRLQENPMVLLPYLESNLPHEVFEKLVAMIGGGRPVSEKAEVPVPSKEETDDEAVRQIPGLGRDLRRESVISRFRSATIASAATPTGKRRQSDASVMMERGGEISRSASKESEIDSSGTPEITKEGRASTSSVAGDPYRSFLKRREYGSPQSQKRSKSAKPIAVRRSSEDVNVNKVAEDFCDWMRGVGGEDPKYNSEPDKIITLFAIDTETKPTVSTAIQVLDQANIPEELMADKQTAAASSAGRGSGRTVASEFAAKPKKKVPLPKKGPSKFTRYRYGAWYLDVESWKKLGVTELLEDPEELEKRQAYEASLRSDEVDQQLAVLFSVRSLRDYFKKTNIKLPHFLKNVPNPYESTVNEAFQSGLGLSKGISSVRL